MTYIDQAILVTLAMVAVKHRKYYCYPSQAKILELLETKQKVSISRRTLNRHLSKLEGQHWFRRIRRHKAGPGGKILFHSTLYRLTTKISVWVNKTCSWAKWFGKKFFELFRVPYPAQHKSAKKTYIFRQSAGGLNISNESDLLEGDHLKEKVNNMTEGSRRSLPPEIKTELEAFYQKDYPYKRLPVK